MCEQLRFDFVGVCPPSQVVFVKGVTGFWSYESIMSRVSAYPSRPPSRPPSEQVRKATIKKIVVCYRNHRSG